MTTGELIFSAGVVLTVSAALLALAIAVSGPFMKRRIQEHMEEKY